MFDAGSLVDLINKIPNKNIPRLHNFLDGCRIYTTHLPVRKNKAGDIIRRDKTIRGLADPKDPFKYDKKEKKLIQVGEHPAKVKARGANAYEVEFWLDNDKKYVSVYKFFKDTYNYTIKIPQMPVVNVGTEGSPTYLPAEVCEVIPGTPCKGKLEPGQTAQMIRFAVRGPAANATSITQQGVRAVGLLPQDNSKLVRH